MGQPYVGEIRMFGGSFAPQGWAFCDGGLVAIVDNTTLFNLIGTTYGGDGQSTFALPDLRGRVPVHQGQGSGLSPRVIGLSGGAEANTPSPTLQSTNLIAGSGATVAVSATGQVPTTTPFLGVNFIISLFGIFPSPN